MENLKKRTAQIAMLLIFFSGRSIIAADSTTRPAAQNDTVKKALISRIKEIKQRKAPAASPSAPQEPETKEKRKNSPTEISSTIDKKESLPPAAEQLQTMLIDERNQKESLRQELESAKSALNTAQQQAEDLLQQKQQWQESQQQLARSASLLQRIMKEKDETSAHNLALTNTQGTIQEKFTTYKLQAENEQKTLVKQQDMLKTRLQEIQTILDQAKKTMASKDENSEAELTKLQTQLAKASDDTQKARSELEEQSKANRELLRQLEENEPALKEEIPSNTDARFAEREKRWRNQLADYSALQDQNMATIESLRQQINQLNNDVDKQTKVSNILKRSADDLADQLLTTQKDNRELNTTLSASNTEKINLQTTVERTTIELNKSKEQLEAAKAEAAKVPELQSKVTSREKELKTEQKKGSIMAESVAELSTFLATDLLENESLSDSWQNNANKIMASLKPYIKELKQSANAYKNIHNYVIALAKLSKDKKTPKEFLTDQLFKFVQKIMQQKGIATVETIESFYAQLYSTWTLLHEKESEQKGES